MHSTKYYQPSQTCLLYHLIRCIVHKTRKDDIKLKHLQDIPTIHSHLLQVFSLMFNMSNYILMKLMNCLDVYCASPSCQLE